MPNPTSSQLHHGRRRSLSDPLAAALLPPPNESPEQRERRLLAEEEARRRSETIDRMLRDDDKGRRRKKVVKVLLLGQSESGKSTTLKQFQLLHTPSQFHAERIAWRFVIYLNLVRSIRRILEAIGPDSPDADAPEEPVDPDDTASLIISGSPAPAHTAAHFEGFRRRLAPLLDLEQRLIQQLSDPDDNAEQEPTRIFPNNPWGLHQPHIHPYVPEASGSRVPPRLVIPGASGAASPPTSPASVMSSNSSAHAHEVTVRHGSRWKQVFAYLNQSPKSAHSGELQGWWEDPDDPVHTMNWCAPAMSELWRDPKVRTRLAERQIRLEESSGFYLNDIDRITAKMFFPTDDDVLKARLKTTGVVEHTFALPRTGEWRGVEWKIYDVGGARNQRQAWAPYFDDVNAIIFLAPISAFDQVLVEDPRVNRLEDSFQLWKSVVENKLLSHVNIILFLNKIDLLKNKLERGVRLSHHMPRYNRPNDYETVSSYFRNHFGAIHQQATPNKDRELFVHLTSVTDTRKTHTIISNVRDIILTTNLRMSSLM